MRTLASDAMADPSLAFLASDGACQAGFDLDWDGGLLSNGTKVYGMLLTAYRRHSMSGLPQKAEPATSL